MGKREKKQQKKNHNQKEATLKFDGSPSIEGIVIDKEYDTSSESNNQSSSVITMTVEELEAALVAAANRGAEKAASIIAQSNLSNTLPETAATESSADFVEAEASAKAEVKAIERRRKIEEQRLVHAARLRNLVEREELRQYKKDAEEKYEQKSREEMIKELNRLIDGIDKNPSINRNSPTVSHQQHTSVGERSSNFTKTVNGAIRGMLWGA